MSEGPDHLVLAEMLGPSPTVWWRWMQTNSAARANTNAAPSGPTTGTDTAPGVWETRAGRVDLKIPKQRKVAYFPKVLEPRRAAKKTMAAVILEAYVQGLSTRSIDDLIKAMGMTGVSESQVSRLCSEIDERVEAFLKRPLEGDGLYLWPDATYSVSSPATRSLPA